MSKKTNGSTVLTGKRPTFRERMGAQTDDSMKHYEQFRLRQEKGGRATVRLLLIDIVLVFLVALVIIGLMVFMQTVGVATLDVAFSSGTDQPAIAGIIFTSAVVGGLCGAVVSWAPRIFTSLRRMVRSSFEGTDQDQAS